jgi:hypothetical protein
MAPSDLIRLAAALLAHAAGAAAIALAALLLHDTPGPVSSAPAPAAAAPAPAAKPAPSFPAPPAHAVVFAREDGADALALALAKSFVQVSVVGPQGTGVSGLAVTVNGEQTTPCGPGCYRAGISGPRIVDVRVGETRWHVEVPAPSDAAAIVARAGRVWRSLHSLAFSNRLGSDATHVVVSEWRAVAPNRLAYTVRGGYRAVIVGGRRWDKAPHGRWIETAQSVPVRQPAPVWQSATDANVVSEIGATLRITFFDSRTPAWFEITVDARTMRTLDLRMTTTAHFMHERYRSFDVPLSVTPPR